MAKEFFKSKRFGNDKLLLIEQANEIIEEYQEQGFILTLRQLFYQMVTREIIRNAVEEYNRLGKTISEARLAGLVDWEAITDRTRNLQSLTHWKSPAEILDVAARGFKIDRWSADYQSYRPEVWIEKDALVGVIEGVCETYDVPFIACRGYMSQSEMYDASKRFSAYIEEGQTPFILHLGDHDSSGIDMTRDIGDRLDLFMGGMDIERLALNIDQVQTYKPPPNPAKMTDPRAGNYVKQFGRVSWELDALSPKVIAGVIENAILELIDRDGWQRAVEIEKKGRGQLTRMIKKLEV